MLDDYSRGNGPPDFDTRGGGPPMKRQRLDALNDGHWANAPTDRRGTGFPSMPSHGHLIGDRIPMIYNQIPVIWSMKHSMIHCLLHDMVFLHFFKQQLMKKCEDLIKH